MTIHRCEHLKANESGRSFSAGWGIDTEVCDACFEELAHRLGEVEIKPGLPIIAAIANATGTQQRRVIVSEPCIYGAKFEKDKYGQPTKNLLRKCNRLCDPGKKLCPRCELLQAAKEEAKANRTGTSARCGVAAKVAR